MRLGKLAAIATAAALGTGCFSIPTPYGIMDRAVSRSVDSASDRAGDQAGQAVADRTAARFNPMMGQFYMQMVFTMAFSSGGYAVGQAGYKPGDYTRWSIPGEGKKEKESQMERAYLFDDRDGNPWWKVKWVLDTENAAKGTLIVEALFEKGTGKLLRERIKMPNEEQGKEVPVDEATYYQPPRQLTKQSLEGATIGVESVSVPAGTFTAKHVQYGDMNGTSDFFLADTVPGGLVKSSHASGRSSKGAFQMLLTAYGRGAASELGIKP
jgi:hypothetical protein